MVEVSVDWNGHFLNKIHKQGHFLAEIESYPIQFKDLEDDGILMSMKYVSLSFFTMLIIPL